MTINIHRRYLLLLGCLTSLTTMLLSAVSVFGADDLLLLPAKKTERAVSSFLTDVVNTGARLIAVGDRGHILISDNQGKHWAQAACPVSVMLTSVYFPTPQKGWAVGHDGLILHTPDGGTTWVKQLDGFQANEIETAYFQNLVKAKETEFEYASDSLKAEMQKDLGALRSALGYSRADSEDGAWKPFMDVWFRDENEGFAVGAFGYIFHTKDGGATWHCWRNRIDNPESLHYNGIAPAGQALFIAAEAGTLYRSMDYGEHWERVTTFYDGTFFGIVGTPSGDSVIAFGLVGRAFISRDLGQSWDQIKTSIGATLSSGAVLSDGAIAVVSYSGAVLISRDQGREIMVQETGICGLSAVTEITGRHLVVTGLTGLHQIIRP